MDSGTCQSQKELKGADCSAGWRNNREAAERQVQGVNTETAMGYPGRPLWFCTSPPAFESRGFVMLSGVRLCERCHSKLTFLSHFSSFKKKRKNLNS